MFCLSFLSFSPSLRLHSQWRPPWQRVPVWHSVHTWATWAQAWAWCLSCCPVLPCWFLGVPPAWQPWPTAPPHKNICAQTSWRYATCVQLLCWYVWPQYVERWMLISAPADPRQVCREFQRGNCTRGESDCRYAHPLEAGMVDCSENSVIVCMDYIKGRCSRDKCKYFHPPAHLQARIKAAQHQASQNTASAALVSPSQHCDRKYFLLRIHWTVNCRTEQTQV